jgi:DNA-binding NarL/FixJ family response regulator
MLVSIVVADDHKLTADGIQGLLTRETNGSIRAVCGESGVILPALRKHTPDILTLDLSLPGLSGLDILPKVSTVSSNTKTIIYTSYDTEEYVIRAFRLGASGYVLKSDSPAELAQAIRHAIKGKRYLSSSLPDDLLDLVDDGSPEFYDRFDQLTKRETEVLDLVVKGLTSAEIGEQLFISKRTVDKHRQNIMSKLNVSRTTELIRLVNENQVSDSGLE